MASKRNVKRRLQCTNKRKYVSEQEALPHAVKLHKRDNQWINIYKCCYCGFYHVGHSRRSVANEV